MLCLNTHIWPCLVKVFLDEVVEAELVALVQLYSWQLGQPLFSKPITAG